MSNRLEILFINENNTSDSGKLDKLPDHCPLCHQTIDPIKISGYLNTYPQNPNSALEVIFRCPSSKCYEVFIGYYSKNYGSNLYFFNNSKPKNFIQKEFSQTIKDISLNFVTIYNQALSAENSGLSQICGTGYRKALEFLIKDYLTRNLEESDEKEKIKDERLGFCIEKRIKDDSIKQVAKRAAWLGNDETHYFRKWEDKDLTDLKKLIDLTAHWMEAEALTEQLLKDMPEKTDVV